MACNGPLQNRGAQVRIPTAQVHLRIAQVRILTAQVRSKLRKFIHNRFPSPPSSPPPPSMKEDDVVTTMKHTWNAAAQNHLKVESAGCSPPYKCGHTNQSHADEAIWVTTPGVALTPRHTKDEKTCVEQSCSTPVQKYGELRLCGAISLHTTCEVHDPCGVWSIAAPHSSARHSCGAPESYD